MRKVTVLGSTGTIGVNTLDVIARHPGRFRVFALSANANADKLFRQCLRFRPDYAVLLDEAGAEALSRLVALEGLPTRVLCGLGALERIASAPEVDCVMAAIVGAAGLKPALAAARAGKTLMLANKEALVMSGAILMDAVRLSGATLLPIDSEHNAIFQALPRDYARGLRHVGVRKILLTASGGPFRTFPTEELHGVTPEQACAHPNWVMGRKISVDSATMMNKGLEVIEAHWLFDAAPEQIEILIHPQSVIHSLVSYADGSMLAQLGNPDMRTPIAHALAYPERIDAGVEALDLVQVGRLDFEPLDQARFPCVRLAFEALHRGGTVPAILNAANEVAVAAFLDGRIRFTAIPRVIERTLESVKCGPASSLEEVLAADVQARETAREQAMKLRV